MKGIILAGGRGSRLSPLTISSSKQLLPVYGQPMVHYPLSTLIHSGVTEVLIITDPRSLNPFQNLLGDGEALGLTINYEIQEQPRGIAEAFLIGKDFIADDPVALILGDNIFHGAGLGVSLSTKSRQEGATIFASRVRDASSYGVVEFDENGKPQRIIEKPKKTKSNMAVTGLYFYENSVVSVAEQLKPSSRGELEITDVNNYYLNQGKLDVVSLPRGSVWFDAGTTESLYSAAEYVRAIQLRQGLMVGCPQEAAWRRGLIDSRKLHQLAAQYSNSEFGDYLYSLRESDL